MVEEIRCGDELIALIVSHRFRAPGIRFFSPPQLSQQLAYMRHPAGKVVRAHVHNAVERQVQQTQEVLVVRSGRVRVDLYDGGRTYLESRVLETGDVILLVSGGHGFEMLEETELLEVKQGPYLGDQDKTTFDGVGPDRIRLGRGP
jgi:mannose-6-phosphate isomerase-like protein (cupin superfamily)